MRATRPSRAQTFEQGHYIHTHKGAEEWMLDVTCIAVDHRVPRRIAPPSAQRSLSQLWGQIDHLEQSRKYNNRLALFLCFWGDLSQRQKIFRSNGIGIGYAARRTYRSVSDSAGNEAMEAQCATFACTVEAFNRNIKRCS